MGAKMKTLMDYILEEYIVSKTDKKGRITYVNDKFCQISKYSREELLNKPHNIIRHPDMPKEVFKELWDRLKAGKTWSGIIKNKARMEVLIGYRRLFFLIPKAKDICP
jgi:PAS fold.